MKGEVDIIKRRKNQPQGRGYQHEMSRRLLYGQGGDGGIRLYGRKRLSCLYRQDRGLFVLIALDQEIWSF
jgi:hypothetical protein